MLKQFIVTLTIYLLALTTAHAQEDPRIVVEYPKELKQKMLSNMRDHMSALNDILESIAFDELDKASEIAKSRLSLEARGTHNSSELGKLMPPGMREAGYSMHSSASQFAKTAKNGTKEDALEALTAITQACVECHAGYRLK
jgi:hypothetical protein